MLEEVKLLLGIEDDSRNELLELLIRNAETQLIGRLDELVLDPPVVPEPLAYIVVELVVARYNRIGAEGASSQSVEGYSVNYRDNDLTPYELDIERYLSKFRVPKTGVVRFL